MRDAVSTHNNNNYEVIVYGPFSFHYHFDAAHGLFLALYICVVCIRATSVAQLVCRMCVCIVCVVCVCVLCVSVCCVCLCVCCVCVCVCVCVCCVCVCVVCVCVCVCCVCTNLKREIAVCVLI